MFPYQRSGKDVTEETSPSPLVSEPDDYKDLEDQGDQGDLEDLEEQGAQEDIEKQGLEVCECCIKEHQTVNM